MGILSCNRGVGLTAVDVGEATPILVSPTARDRLFELYAHRLRARQPQLHVLGGGDHQFDILEPASGRSRSRARRSWPRIPASLGWQKSPTAFAGPGSRKGLISPPKPRIDRSDPGPRHRGNWR